jgi:hypothetical protein
MRYLNKRRKGMVLMFCLYFVIILAGLSSAAFIRVMSESSNYAREKDRIIAFYNAEAGLAYGYAELSKHGFNWFTIDENGDPISGVTTAISGAHVVDGIYTVDGQSFSVKSHVEIRDLLPTGIIILRSQGTSHGVTRTLEHRVAQESAYQYFFFFPGNMTFGGGATYNGRNYGGIHVNGDITFHGHLYLKYLTEFTSAGYMKRYFVDSNPSDANGPRSNLSGNINYETSSTNVQNLSGGTYFYGANYYLFNNDNIYFTTGDYSGAHVDTTLKYLSGDNAAWTFDEYNGSSTSNFSYIVGNEDLKNLAIREALTGSDGYTSGYYGLFENKHLSVTVTDALGNVSTTSYDSEKEAFREAYAAEAAGKTIDWESFWSAWKGNHAADYSSVGSGIVSSADLDWQRRFFQAAYNLGSAASSVTSQYYNKEWLSDMVFGDDRSDGDDSELASPFDGYGQYYLNTEKQASAWGQYLADNNLNQEGDNKTYVADKTQGGQFIDTGDILSTYGNTNTLKQKAQNGGIYIGPEWSNPEAGKADFNDDGAVDGSDLSLLGANWGKTTSVGDANGDGIVNQADADILSAHYNTKATFVNPISDCSTVVSFYNSQNPGKKGVLYEPSAVLKIDVNALKSKIEAEGSELAGFNGIVYVNLPASQDWSGTGRVDYKADGVMLYNSEVLPEGGLSLVTVNNVYLKGSFNLDAAGDSEKNRDKDSTTVLTNAINDKDYIDSMSDFSWQPAEVITRRYIYALSNEFPEPAYMPMSSYYPYEYYEENTNNTVSYDYVNNLYYPTDSWVPDASTIVTKSGASSNLSKWFSYTGTTMPANFDSTWINNNWGDSNQVFSFDTNTDGIVDTYILANDLRSAVTSAIGTAYAAEFAYDKSAPEDVSLVNAVTKPYVYNTAIVSPYSVSASVLENWNSASLTINGAFIQLPADKQAVAPSLANYYNYRYGNPSSRVFNYESRYGKNSSASDRPNTGLTFGADSSWREVSTF